MSGRGRDPETRCFAQVSQSGSAGVDVALTKIGRCLDRYEPPHSKRTATSDEDLLLPSHPYTHPVNVSVFALEKSVDLK